MFSCVPVSRFSLKGTGWTHRLPSSLDIAYRIGMELSPYIREAWLSGRSVSSLVHMTQRPWFPWFQTGQFFFWSSGHLNAPLAQRRQQINVTYGFSLGLIQYERVCGWWKCVQRVISGGLPASSDFCIFSDISHLVSYHHPLPVFSPDKLSEILLSHPSCEWPVGDSAN